MLGSGTLFQGLISPGATGIHHAFIADCGACHTRVATNFSELLELGVSGFNAKHKNLGEKCLDCHVFNDTAFNPHGATITRLETLTAHLGGKSVGDIAEDSPVACATCHDIHQQDAPGGIRPLTNTQCQICHAAQYLDFETDHPAFTQLPAYTPRLLFDHLQHYRDHFDKQSVVEYAPGNCTDCHQTSANADLQFAGFDSMCADCHLRTDIIEKQLDRIGPTSLIAIPRMDTDRLAIGYWPNCRTTRFKRISDLPLIMRAMLETDASAAAAITVLENHKTSLHSMNGASEEERTAATRLAWAIKALVQDIAADNAVERFTVGTESRNISSPYISDIIARLPIDIRRRMAENWFPDLDAEMTRMTDVTAGSCPDRADWKTMREIIEKKKRDINANAGWYLQAKSSYMALSYVPQQHLDPLMIAIAKITQKFPRDVQLDAKFQCAKCHGFETGDGQYAVQWPLDVAAGKIRFSHASHITTGRRCDQCHELTGSDEPDHIAVLDHLSIDKNQCSVCHDGATVEQRCVFCHEYHWQGFSAPVVSTNLPDFE